MAKNLHVRNIFGQKPTFVLKMARKVATKNRQKSLYFVIKRLKMAYFGLKIAFTQEFWEFWSNAHFFSLLPYKNDKKYI